MAQEQERTEKPSGKRLRDARQRGQFVHSRDLAVAGATLAATMALAGLGGRLYEGLANRLAADLGSMGENPLRAVTGGELDALVMGGGWLIAFLVGPIALCTAGAAVLIHGAQGGFVLATDTLKIDWTRLNPANGIKRLGISQSGVDTLKTLVSVAAIAVLGWMSIKGMLADSGRIPWMSPVGAAAVGWSSMQTLMWRVALALVLLALGDYGLQYYRTMSALKMTKQELKDEAKESEGNAEVKGRIRRVQREMARRRMLSDVKKAAVVITNPTHFAVALEYKRGSMTAPRVLAKGQDHVAFTIREQARKHGIPMVENKPLAQALFKTTEVGDVIPAGLFSAVAEVLAQLIRLKQLVL
jgi:flagellar biosynthetic protein FlhB